MSELHPHRKLNDAVVYRLNVLLRHIDSQVKIQRLNVIVHVPSVCDLAQREHLSLMKELIEARGYVGVSRQIDPSLEILLYRNTLQGKVFLVILVESNERSLTLDFLHL